MRRLIWIVGLGLLASPGYPCDYAAPISDFATENADPYFRFTRIVGGKTRVGYIDRTGTVMLQPRFPAYAGEFHDGLLVPAIGEGPHTIKGEVAFERSVVSFSDGLARSRDPKTKLTGFVDTSGEWVISPRFAPEPEAEVGRFVGGMASVRIGSHWGFIDKSGAWAIEPQFLWVSDFRDGIASVVTDGPCFRSTDSPCGDLQVLPEGTNPPNAGDSLAFDRPCRYRLIDRTGRLITAQSFERVDKSGDGLVPVKIDDRWGYVDGQGVLVTPASYELATAFSDGLAAVRLVDKWGYIDAGGAMRIPPQFAGAGAFGSGRAAVQSARGGPQYFIDEHGQRAFPGDFAHATGFTHGLAHVLLRTEQNPVTPSRPLQTFAYIDPEGAAVFVYTPEAGRAESIAK